MTLVDGGDAYSSFALPVPIPYPPNTNLSSYQGYTNGLAFGAATNVQLQSIGGLREANVQSGDIPLPRLDGAAPGFNPFVERTLTLTFQAFNPTVPFETVLEAITAAFQPVADPAGLQLLKFLLPGWPSARQVMGRTTKGAIPIDTNYQYNVATVAVEFTCPDPLIYNSLPMVASSKLPSPTAGLTFPATPNFVFGASTGGSFQLTNNGNYPAPMVFTIYGPVTNPVLSLGSLSLGFALALGASDVLVIDTHPQVRSATLNGAASRAGLIITGSTWLQLPIGTSSIGVASSDSAPVAAVFQGSVADAWGFM